MSAETGNDSSQIVNLSPEEKRLFGQLFRQADYDNVSVVTGEIAVSFFEKTKLDTRVLGQIWQIADTENRGFLTPAGFSVALRLIGHAQAGREPSAELARTSGPLPRFDGMVMPSPASPPPPAALQAQGSGGGPVRIPPLTPDKVAQFAGLFERQSLAPGNLLPGDQAKQIFEKSGLPNETLGLVWQLADSEQRGAFLVHEFIIAMHLLNALKTGVLKAVPSALPPALVEAARRQPAPRQSPQPTGPISPIPAQLSGPVGMRTGSPLARGGPQGQPPGGDWLVTPAEKTKFDSIYDGIDKAKRGYITGEEAVPFLSQSNLNGDMLAQIWDLADINSEGHLSRDEFAIAMYLIRMQRARRDGTNIIPATLPPNLIPPSMRNQPRPSTAGAAFDSPPPPQQPQPQPPLPKSAVEDLFGLDAPAPPAAPALTAFATGGSNASDPFGSGSVGIPPGSPSRASPPPPATKFQPFVPSSSFGKGLTQQTTGTAPEPKGDAEDLLGDNDPEVSSKLTNETSELGNISNQIGTLTKQMTNLQTQRTTAQNDLNQSSSQKKNFEQRLTQLRTMYEKEVNDVRTLEEQLSASRADTRKLQAECMSLDGTYQDLQGQHQQVATALQADQQENAALKEKIRTLNAEITQLKPQIEKMKSEARQQKGLVAINKKQLSTNEGERDKLKSEADDLSKESEELSRQTSDGSGQSSSTPQVTSPAVSTASATNPFFKRTASSDVMGAFPTQPMKGSDKLFDDIFGGPSPSTSTPPPTLPQHTGASTGSAGSMATPPVTSPSISRQGTLSAESAVPPPPESRQISSSFLPLKEGTESLSSSRQVSPPQSRLGDEKNDVTSPVPGAFPPIEAVSAGQSRAASPEETKGKTSGDLSNGSAPAPDVAVGEVAEAAPAPAAERSTARDSDPFGAMDHAKAKADFDNAFASFKNNKSQEKSQGAEGTAFSSFNTEFPPISEIERDESDSDSEKGAGFDDDFAPSSPKGKEQEGETEKKAGSPAEDKVEEPRGDEKPAELQPALNNSKSSSADDIFGSALSTPTAAPASQPPAPAPAADKTPFDDDLDDDFEGLEDAKEGSADDDFANISKSGLDDFNSVFDSPQASQVKSESTFDFGTLSTGSLPGAPVGANAAAVPAGDAPAPAAKTDAGDWDAMFSGLEPAGSGSPEEKAGERPGTKRADTGEDDPMLTQLVGMGYSRDSAVAALEKYDYNLERAANHLASQS